MKRLTLTAAATLLLGSSAYAQGPAPFARAASPHPTVTLCELARDPALYRGKVIRVAGVARGSTGGTFILRDDEGAEGRCESEDAAAFVLNRGRSVGVGQPLDGFFPKAGVGSAEHRPTTARVEVVGKFDDGEARGAGCFGPRFSIEASTVRRLSPAAPLFLE